MPALDSTEAGRILAAQLKATAYTPPTNVYVALGTTQPNVTTMTTEVSPGANAYARQIVTFGTVSGGAVSSSSAATFTNMPGPTTVSAVELHGASTGTAARLYWQGATQGFSAKTTAAGDTLTFAAGSISAALT